jgi:hypothetical protein
MREFAIEVLIRANQPLNYNDIWKRMKQLGYANHKPAVKKAASPEASLLQVIRGDLDKIDTDFASYGGVLITNGSFKGGVYDRGTYGLNPTKYPKFNK